MKNKMFVYVFVVFIFSAVLFISCKGDKGDTGAPGPAGVSADKQIFEIQFQTGLHPDSAYDGCQDTYVVDSIPNTNFGQCGGMGIGIDAYGSIMRAFIKFSLIDLLGKNVTIKEAYLYLYPNSGGGAVTITAYNVTTQWAEGPGGCVGYSDVPPATSWIYPWTNQGGDYGTAIASPQYFDINSGSGLPIVFKIDAAVVQDWVDNPTMNNGILLKISDESNLSMHFLNFATSEEASILSLRPKFDVFYTKT